MSRSLYALHDTDLLMQTSDEQAYVLRLRDLPAEEKPREKIIKYGPDVLSAYELLAIVLNVGTKKEDVFAMAHRVLHEYGEQSIAHQKDVKTLMKELDLPETKVCQMVACFELGRRFFNNGTGRAVTLRTPKQVFAHVKKMGELPKEHLRGLYLNNHYRLIHDEVISIGSITANIIHPREVFRPAIEFGASAIILAHNHPSGSCKPSDADIEITKQIAAAGEMMGIELLDHLVIGKRSFENVPFK